MKRFLYLKYGDIFHSFNFYVACSCSYMFLLVGVLFSNKMQKKEKVKKEEKVENFSVKTLNLLSTRLDEIVGKSELINELLEEEDDPRLIKLLDKKLTKLENELEYIGNKIRIEQEIIKNSK